MCGEQWVFNNRVELDTVCGNGNESDVGIGAVEIRRREPCIRTGGRGGPGARTDDE